MGAFEWTTPSRRTGSRVLSPIPHEVYLEIYKYFEPSEVASHADCKRVLSNLALVCRFFCAVSISRIYRSIEFSGRDVSPGYNHFCQLLLKSTESNGNSQSIGSDVQFAVDIAPFVRECLFKDWLPRPDQISWAEAFLERNSRAVRLMPNVESLRIDSTPITKSLITTISKLNETLKTLCIRSCTLEGELTKAQLLGLDSLRLRVVEFFGASSVSQSLSPATIRLRDLEIFRTDSWQFGYFFMKRQHPALRVLELHDVEDLPALFKFLSKSPSIRELTIAGIVLQLGGGPIPTLSPTALPHVHTIHIPSSFLPFFSNRSLRNVSLVGVEARDFDGSDRRQHPTLPQLTVKDVASLMQSATSITELHVPEHVYFVFPVLKNLKNLEVLVLVYDHPNFSTVPVISSTKLFRDAIHALCNKWPASPSPPLRELRLDFGATVAADARPFMWDLQLQLEMLMGPLSVTFPHLTSASVARFVKWQRWDKRSEWRPFVPHGFRDFVKDALARGRPFTDVGDCFAPLDYK